MTGSLTIVTSPFVESSNKTMVSHTVGEVGASSEGNGASKTDIKQVDEPDSKDNEEVEEEEESGELLYHVRWQLSRSLTTQHLLTVVSITNTLMNQSSGAHALASSSGIGKVCA